MKPLKKQNDIVVVNGLRNQSAFFYGFFICILLLLCYFIFFSEPVQKRWFYPFPYQEIVEKYAYKYKIDVDLAASVINKESKFQSKAVSHRGALGLMQLMPDTAEWIADELEEKDFSLEKLYDPETNIRFGIWYLASLKKEFKNNECLVLAAYNAGRGNVREWMELYDWDYDFNEINEIPFHETKMYVFDVIKGKERYKKLYWEKAYGKRSENH